MSRVKVCGHTSAEDVAASIAAGVDAVGVIADVPVETPREVDTATAADLLDLPPFVSGVLVTMPETAAAAIDLVAATDPDALQVHAGLAVEELEAVATAIDIPLIVALSVDDNPASIAEVADAILLDSRDEDGAGGTGRTHDWTRAREIRDAVDVPVVLAGGLTPENVAEGIRSVDPYAVDVATGVESSGGIKDHAAVRRFVSRARQEVLEA